MNELITGEDDETSSFLSDTLQNLMEGITGIASSEKKEWCLSVGYLLQRLRNGRFIETLKEEWDQYREKGRIDDDYLNTEQHQECLQEMLDFLDNDSPDKIRFAVLKNIFLNAATEEITSRDDLLPQQLMRICRSLNSTEVLILEANYKLAKQICEPKPTWSIQYGASDWLKAIVKNSVLRFPELVESHESTLINKGLISPRKHSDRSGVYETDHYRLTDLGYELCRFMTEHEPDNNDSGNSSND